MNNPNDEPITVPSGTISSLFFLISDLRNAFLTDDQATPMDILAGPEMSAAYSDLMGLIEAHQERSREPIKLFYRNHRGEVSLRTFIPHGIWHGSTDWHPEPQYLVRGYDTDKDGIRDYALKDFLGALGESEAHITVGGGLEVRGSMEAVSRVQQYILLDSEHANEKKDVNRRLMRDLERAEGRFQELVENVEDVLTKTQAALKERGTK